VPALSGIATDRYWRISGRGLKGECTVEFDSTPGRPPDGPGLPPRLAEVLAGMAPGALANMAPAAVADIAEVIGLHREFPWWAVWLPDGRRRWIAVRPASARAPGPDLPMIWVHADAAAALADRMRAADGQLAPAVNGEAAKVEMGADDEAAREEPEADTPPAELETQEGTKPERGRPRRWWMRCSLHPRRRRRFPSR
jgi:hypothetical protein